jgi:hypothetical protein
LAVQGEMHGDAPEVATPRPGALPIAELIQALFNGVT